MSSGDIDEKADETTYRQLLARRPDLMAYVELPREVNRFFDIPYLAGVSRNATTLYIDQFLPVRLQVGKKTLDPATILVYHEYTEDWAMREIPRITYEDAHHIANAAEEHRCHMLRVPWEAWNSALDKYVKMAEQKTVHKAPRDLKLYPYVGTKFMKVLERFQ